MARARLSMAALLAGVSTLAIGTAFAASGDEGWTADKLAGPVFAAVMCIVYQGLYLGWNRVFRRGPSSFWTSRLGRWLIGRLAGTAVFACLLGAGFFLAMRSLEPILDILVRLGVPFSKGLLGSLVLAMWLGPVAAAWKLRTFVKVCIGKGSRPLRRLVRSLGMGRGGSSAFAGICEEWANRWKPGRILLGASMYDRKWLVGIRDDRMMMTAAGTGAGKGRTAIIPNLLTYPGSVYCQDFKGQNAAVTAQRRREMGQAVHVLDPMGALTENGARLNPLDPLDPKSRDYVEQIDAIVDALVIAGDDKNRFFDESRPGP